MNLGNLYRHLGDRMRWRQLARNETLFHCGDPATAIFAVGHGRVRLIRHTHGAAVVQHVARAGETLAEAALFAESYHCDAIAEVPSRVAVIPREVLLDSIEKDPALRREFLAAMAQQIQDARRRLQLRNIRPARERVWEYLLLCAHGGHLEIDGPMREIAGEIGLSPEALYRALAELKTEGRLRGSGRDLRLGPRKSRES